ncbi:MAG: hypothetical protein AVDCRST_MAG28-2756, partial [uncultured Rubrobacteraceae bacterium]
GALQGHPGGTHQRAKARPDQEGTHHPDAPGLKEKDPPRSPGRGARVRPVGGNGGSRGPGRACGPLRHAREGRASRGRARDDQQARRRYHARGGGALTHRARGKGYRPCKV